MSDINAVYQQNVERIRRRNLEFLRSLNLPKWQGKPMTIKRSVPLRPRRKVAAVPSRKSARLQGKKPRFGYGENKSPDKKVAVNMVKRPNSFGEIPGIRVGTVFESRLDASRAGVHRPTVAGIHGNSTLGCYSVVLSGGYEDNYDYGEVLVYTGAGGRNLKGTKKNPKNLRTGPQCKDQVLERGNLALAKSIESKLPVRVLRGFKAKSDFAPPEGYRYDGLYNVIEYYKVEGKSGYKVFRFRLNRIKQQEPAPYLRFPEGTFYEAPESP